MIDIYCDTIPPEVTTDSIFVGSGFIAGAVTVCGFCGFSTTIPAVICGGIVGMNVGSIANRVYNKISNDADIIHINNH